MQSRDPDPTFLFLLPAACIIGMLGSLVFGVLDVLSVVTVSHFGHETFASIRTDDGQRAISICDQTDIAKLLLSGYDKRVQRRPIRVFKAVEREDVYPTRDNWQKAETEAEKDAKSDAETERKLGFRIWKKETPAERYSSIEQSARVLGQLELVFSTTRKLVHHNRVDGPYFVFLTGTDFRSGAGVLTDILASVGAENRYSAALATVLKSPKLFRKRPDMVVVAHSLGGMVAMRVLADPRIRARFHNVTLVAFGVPNIGKQQYSGSEVYERALHTIALVDIHQDEDRISHFGLNLDTGADLLDVPRWSRLLAGGAQAHLSYERPIDSSNPADSVLFRGGLLEKYDGLLNESDGSRYRCVALPQRALASFDL